MMMIKPAGNASLVNNIMMSKSVELHGQLTSARQRPLVLPCRTYATFFFNLFFSVLFLLFFYWWLGGGKKKVLDGKDKVEK